MDQRFAGGYAGADHFADKDVMIARYETLMDGALDGGKDSGNQGNSRLPAFPSEAIETVQTPAGKTIRNGLLMLGQYVDSKKLARAEVIDYGNLMAEANKDQRGLQRNGCEGTNGQSMGAALSVQDGGNRDAGSEAAAGMPGILLELPGGVRLTWK